MAIIEVHDLTKRFGEVTAVDGLRRTDCPVAPELLRGI